LRLRAREREFVLAVMGGRLANLATTSTANWFARSSAAKIDARPPTPLPCGTSTSRSLGSIASG